MRYQILSCFDIVHDIIVGFTVFSNKRFFFFVLRPTVSIKLLSNRIPTYYYTCADRRVAEMIINKVNVGPPVSQIIINDFNFSVSGQCAQTCHLGKTRDPGKLFILCKNATADNDDNLNFCNFCIFQTAFQTRKIQYSPFIIKLPNQNYTFWCL